MADEIKKEAHVVKGSETFDHVVRPRGGKRQARAYWLKDRAEDRLMLLLAKGEEGDRLARSMPPIARVDRAAVVYSIQFGKQSDRARLVIMRGKVLELESELANLKKAPVKRAMFEETIKTQITELCEDIKYLEEEKNR